MRKVSVVLLTVFVALLCGVRSVHAEDSTGTATFEPIPALGEEQAPLPDIPAVNPDTQKDCIIFVTQRRHYEPWHANPAAVPVSNPPWATSIYLYEHTSLENWLDQISRIKCPGAWNGSLFCRLLPWWDTCDRNSATCRSYGSFSLSPFNQEKPLPPADAYFTFAAGPTFYPPEVYTDRESGETFELLSGPYGSSKPAVGGECIMLAGNVVSPLVVDLTGAGIHYTGFGENVNFNLGRGLHPTHWIANPVNAAFLAIDRNNNGKIDDYTELFGNFSPGADRYASSNGFDTLAEFDVNKDGQINASDPVFLQLRLWSDENTDASSTPEELKTLPAAGITSIDLHYRPERSQQDQYGNFNSGKSFAVTSSGSKLAVYDVWFSEAEEDSVRNPMAVLEKPAPMPAPGGPNYPSFSTAFAKLMLDGEWKQGDWDFTKGEVRTVRNNSGEVKYVQGSWTCLVDTCRAQIVLNTDGTVRSSEIHCFG